MMSFRQKRNPGVSLTLKEEAQIRREINEGVPHDEICQRWKIKIPRLRVINAGPLQKLTYAIEAIKRK